MIHRKKNAPFKVSFSFTFDHVTYIPFKGVADCLGSVQPNLLIVITDALSKGNLKTLIPETFQYLNSLKKTREMFDFSNLHLVGPNSGPNQAALFTGKLVDGVQVCKTFISTRCYHRPSQNLGTAIQFFSIHLSLHFKIIQLFTQMSDEFSTQMEKFSWNWEGKWPLVIFLPNFHWISPFVSVCNSFKDQIREDEWLWYWLRYKQYYVTLKTEGIFIGFSHLFYRHVPSSQWIIDCSSICT